VNKTATFKFLKSENQGTFDRLSARSLQWTNTSRVFPRSWWNGRFLQN